MKPSVYIETSVISYLTSRTSTDLIMQANQEITKRWWRSADERFELFVSAVVLKEISLGDKNAAKARIEVANQLAILEFGAESVTMARAIVEAGALPKKAEEDAMHIAIACYGGIDYLVTWNCTHIANAEIRKMIEIVARKFGVQCPIICTPQELMGMKRG